MGKEGMGMPEIEEIRIKVTRGIPGQVVDEAVLREGFGIVGDIFAGKKGREITLFEADARAESLETRGDGMCVTRFSENFLVKGLELMSLAAGTRLSIGEAEIELTQIGKECHEECPVFQREGNCGLFGKAAYASVVRGGLVQKGDPIIRL